MDKIADIDSSTLLYLFILIFASCLFYAIHFCTPRIGCEKKSIRAHDLGEFIKTMFMVWVLGGLCFSIFLIATKDYLFFRRHLAEAIIYSLVMMSVYFFYKKWAVKKEYFKCPYCGYMTLLKFKWQCEHCDNVQQEPIHIYKKCGFCGEYQVSAFCEKCKEEFIL